MRSAGFLLIAAGLATAGDAASRTWHVEPDGSGDAPTIAAAIDSAAAADTVLVACGTYAEHGIEMKSGVVLRSATGFPDCATIDAERAARVLTCSEADSTTVIEGFTLTGGHPPDHGGGAVYCWRSAPTIVRCDLVDNLVTTITAKGGALRSDISTPVLIDCVIARNRAPYGGAIFSVFARGPTLTRCAFEDNVADEAGGALYLHMTSPDLSDTTPVITDCVFTGNRAPEGGAVYVWRNSVPKFVDCTFAGNEADVGGAVGCRDAAHLTFEGCTLDGNGSDGSALGAAMWVGNYSSVSLRRTIVAFHSGGEAFACERGTATLACSDVHGTEGGDFVGCILGQLGVDGNFSQDPLFCDRAHGDYRLHPDSPCLPGNHPDGASCGLIGAHPAGDCEGVVHLPIPADIVAGRLRALPVPSSGRVTMEARPPGSAPARIVILDVHGRIVRELVATAGDETARAGALVWDGSDARGSPVPSGVYFLHARAGAWERCERIVIAR
jgi:hypothetical protein